MFTDLRRCGTASVNIWRIQELFTDVAAFVAIITEIG